MRPLPAPKAKINIACGLLAHMFATQPSSVSTQPMNTNGSPTRCPGTDLDIFCWVYNFFYIYCFITLQWFPRSNKGPLMGPRARRKLVNFGPCVSLLVEPNFRYPKMLPDKVFLSHLFRYFFMGQFFPQDNFMKWCAG